MRPPKGERKSGIGRPYADKNPYVGPNAVLEGLFARLAGEWDGS
jgi:hypothetical protein